jgi:hypothetical protein
LPSYAGLRISDLLADGFADLGLVTRLHAGMLLTPGSWR